jgi:hypothetical protein
MFIVWLWPSVDFQYHGAYIILRPDASSSSSSNNIERVSCGSGQHTVSVGNIILIYLRRLLYTIVIEIRNHLDIPWYFHPLNRNFGLSGSPLVHRWTNGGSYWTILGPPVKLMGMCTLATLLRGKFRLSPVVFDARDGVQPTWAMVNTHG